MNVDWIQKWTSMKESWWDGWSYREWIRIKLQNKCMKEKQRESGGRRRPKCHGWMGMRRYSKGERWKV